MDLNTMTDMERYDASWDPNTPAVALERLARDDDAAVRDLVAGNPNTPAHVKAKLS